MSTNDQKKGAPPFVITVTGSPRPGQASGANTGAIPIPRGQATPVRGAQPTAHSFGSQAGPGTDRTEIGVALPTSQSIESSMGNLQGSAPVDSEAAARHAHPAHPVSLGFELPDGASGAGSTPTRPRFLSTDSVSSVSSSSTAPPPLQRSRFMSTDSVSSMASGTSSVGSDDNAVVFLTNGEETDKATERAMDKACIEFMVARIDDLAVTDVGAGQVPPSLGGDLGVPMATYLKRVMRLTKMPRGVLLVALLLLEKLLARNPNLHLTPINAHRLLLVGSMIAQKLWTDIPYSNKYWAKISGMFELNDLNAMEAEFLVLIDFNLPIEPPLYQMYASYAANGAQGAAALAHEAPFGERGGARSTT